MGRTPLGKVIWSTATLEDNKRASPVSKASNNVAPVPAALNMAPFAPEVIWLTDASSLHLSGFGGCPASLSLCWCGASA